MSDGAKAGIDVGAGVGGLAIITAFYFGLCDGIDRKVLIIPT